MPDYKLRIIVNGEDRASKTFKDVGSAIDDFGSKVSGIGKGLSVGLTVPLVALGAAALKAGTDLNAGLANIASLGIAEERVLQLKANVQDMAIEFGKSTDEMVDGAYQLISTFGDSADTTRLLEISTKAAAAGLATVTDAILLGGAVTKAYGDTSADAYQHVQDLAFTAVNLGVTTFPELAAAMGKVIPLTAALGVSVEDTFGVMATFTGVTGNTAEVTTQLRGVMQSLMDPTAATTELFKAMGIESGKAAIEQLGLQGTMQLMVDAAAAAGLPLSDFIGSIEGQTLAMQAAGGSQEQFTKNLAAMGNVSGALDAAFTAQTTGINALGFQFQQAKSKLQVFLQTISDAMGPAMLVFANAVTPLGDKIQALAVKFAAMDPATQTWIVGLAAGAAALGPVLIAVGAMIPALGTLGTALAALLSPLGLVAAGIAAAFYFDVGGIRTSFMSILTSAQEMGQGVIDALKPLIAGEDFAVLKANVTGAFADIGKAISDYFSGNISLGGLAGAVSEGFSKIRDSLTSFFGGSDFSKFIPEIKWEAFIEKINWTAGIITVLDWASWIPALAWNGFVQLVDWAVYISKLNWGEYIGQLVWDNWISTLSWSDIITDINYLNFVNPLNWSAYVTSVAWDSYIGKMAWSDFVDKLNWPDWIDGLSWTDFATVVQWVNFINPLNWATYVLGVDLADYVPAFPGWSSFMSMLPQGFMGIGTGNNSTGTPSFGGGWTWVGEKGPELLNLPRGSQVLSNQQSMGMIGQLAGGTGGLSAAQQAGFNSFVAAQGQKEADKAAKELKKSVDKMGKTIDKSIDDMAQKLGSILQSIPGLFGTSSVTQEQMDMAKLGVPQNFADDYLRHLTDEVVNGVDWAGVDIADAAARAGIDPSLPHEAILSMFKAAWGDSSLFANAANLDLINQEAVQAGVDKANAQAAGKANIMALFGIAPDEATAQAVTLGASLHTGIQQGITQGNATGAGLGTSLVAGMASDITPESMAPVASAISTGLTTGLSGEDIAFGTSLESVINKQLEGEGLFAGTAGKILEKIAGYFETTEFNVDLVGKFSDIWVAQLGVQSAIDHLLDVGGRIAEIVFKGYQAKSEELDWTGAVTAASLAQTTAATTTTDTTTMPSPDGRGFFGGVRQAATNAAATIINVYATVNNEMDINKLAYQVAAVQQRRR